MARALYANRELERRKQDAIITRISAAYLAPIAREIGTRTVAAANAFERDGEAAGHGGGEAGGQAGGSRGAEGQRRVTQ